MAAPENFKAPIKVSKALLDAHKDTLITLFDETAQKLSELCPPQNKVALTNVLNQRKAEFSEQIDKVVKSLEETGIYINEEMKQASGNAIGRKIGGTVAKFLTDKLLKKLPFLGGIVSELAKEKLKGQVAETVVKQNLAHNATHHQWNKAFAKIEGEIVGAVLDASKEVLADGCFKQSIANGVKKLINDSSVDNVLETFNKKAKNDLETLKKELQQEVAENALKQSKLAIEQELKELNTLKKEGLHAAGMNATIDDLGDRFNIRVEENIYDGGIFKPKKWAISIDKNGSYTATNEPHLLHKVLNQQATSFKKPLEQMIDVAYFQGHRKVTITWDPKDPTAQAAKSQWDHQRNKYVAQQDKAGEEKLLAKIKERRESAERAAWIRGQLMEPPVEVIGAYFKPEQDVKAQDAVTQGLEEQKMIKNKTIKEIKKENQAQGAVADFKNRLGG